MHVSNFRNDWWLPCGIAGFIAGLFRRKISGSTEYQHWIMEVYTVLWYIRIENAIKNNFAAYTIVFDLVLQCFKRWFFWRCKQP